MIKLLVVDDSPLMRRIMGALFLAAGDFEVAFARDGMEALKQIHAFEPDVVTLDVQMPQMDGLACLDRIMVERPCPVVMVSALTAHGAEVTLEAMDLGAVDFVTKPTRAITLEIDSLGPVLVDTVRSAAGAKLRPTHRLAERVRARSGATARAGGTRAPAVRRMVRLDKPATPPPIPPQSGDPPGLVLVGVSTGGPPALDTLLSALPEDFPWPVLIAQHMPATFTGPLSRRLDGLCALSVREVTGPTVLAPGNVYVGRGDADMIVARRPGGLVALPAPSKPEFRWHPSANRLVDSALEHLPAERLAGVLMTGMGDDGAAAMTRLRKGGGRTIAESEETAVVWGMPGALAKAGGAEFVTPLDDIAARLIRVVCER